MNVSYLSPEGEMLLGYDDQCVGWDLHARKIFFNGCAIKNYPEGKLLSYKIPKKFIMIVNLDQGSLSFKADVCYSNLTLELVQK